MTFIDDAREEMRERLEKRREDFEKGQKLQERRSELIQIGERCVKQYEALAVEWERLDEVRKDTMEMHGRREVPIESVLETLTNLNSIERKMRAVKRMQG